MSNLIELVLVHGVRLTTPRDRILRVVEHKNSDRCWVRLEPGTEDDAVEVAMPYLVVRDLLMDSTKSIMWSAMPAETKKKE